MRELAVLDTKSRKTKQEQAVDFIERYAFENGQLPKYDTVMDAVPCGRDTTWRAFRRVHEEQVAALLATGLIVAKKPAGVEIIEDYTNDGTLRKRVKLRYDLEEKTHDATIKITYDEPPEWNDE